MLLEFENKTADFAKTNRLFGNAEKILLAVSGGADSTALLSVMAALRKEGVLDAELICAHINHQLRPIEADADQSFVVRQATHFDVESVVSSVDVAQYARTNKLSIETAARNLRIDKLLEIARARNCTAIATAHQKNDNAETVLHRIGRGTGFRGLAGIWPVRAFSAEVRFVRPLLWAGREEIIDYLKKRNLEWCVDKTNRDCTFRRNYIRHKLMPVLQQQCKGSLVEQLSGLAQSARRFYRFVCDCADKVWEQLISFSDESVSLDLNLFLAQAQPVRVELLRRSLAAVGSGEGDMTEQHYEMILQLARQNISGKRIELPHGFVVLREYENLIFARASESQVQADKVIGLTVPGETTFGSFQVEATVFDVGAGDDGRFEAEKGGFVESFDLDKITLPLKVRRHRPGDRFVPLGTTEGKKVGRFMIDQRIPKRKREKTLVVTDGERIIWVWPIRMSDEAKVTDSTKRLLRLQITEPGETEH